jgi:hypothetical protein
VPTLTCGLDRLNFSLAMTHLLEVASLLEALRPFAACLYAGA